MTDMVSSIDALVSVALFCRAKGGHTPESLAKNLEPLLRVMGASDNLGGRVGQSLAGLQERGLASHAPPGEKKSPRWSLTPTQRSWVEQFVGLRPSRRGPAAAPTWDEMLKKYLGPRALGVAGIPDDQRKRLGTADGLRAEVLRREFCAALPQGSPLSTVKPALLWTLLRDGASAEVVKKAPAGSARLPSAAVILDVLCFSAAGMKTFNKGSKPGVGLEVLVAQRCQATGRGYHQVLLSLVKRLFASLHAPPVTPPEPDTPTPLLRAVAPNGSGAEPAAPASFRDEVLRAARATSTGRYGDHLVLISHVWRELRRQRPTRDLPQFKAELLAAYMRGELTLSKADMPQTLDPRDLDESRVKDHDRELVFVELA